MFRGNIQNGLKFKLEKSLDVVIFGAISLYLPRGSYSIKCFSIEPFGSGALALALEQLKKELEALGYFDKDRKKLKPKIIKKIALITSKSGAAIEDVLRVAKKRWPLVKFCLLNTLVQGEEAKNSIAKNIERADKLGVDAILITRGGGSLEDLWAFNERVVAEAIFSAKTFTISAIGHERDVLISDLVADLRAPTPSAAIEMMLPSIDDYLIYLDELKISFDREFKRALQKREVELTNLKNSMQRYSLFSRIKKSKDSIIELKKALDREMDHKIYNESKISSELIKRFDMVFESILNSSSKELTMLNDTFLKNNPKLKLKRGFAQIIKKDRVSTLKSLKEEDEFTLVDSQSKLLAKALKRV